MLLAEIVLYTEIVLLAEVVLSVEIMLSAEIMLLAEISAVCGYLFSSTPIITKLHRKILIARSLSSDR